MPFLPPQPQLLTGQAPYPSTRNREERRLFSRYRDVEPILDVDPTLPVPIAHVVDKLMAIQPGERILEIGPGPGRLLIPAAGMVGSSGAAVGLELQPKMIEKLKRNAEKAGVKNLQVFQGDASRSQSLQDFDLVYLCTVLGEIPDRAAALQNAWTFLKPGGRLCITEMLGDPHYQSKKTCQQLAEAAGFHLVRINGSWRRFTMTLERPA